MSDGDSKRPGPDASQGIALSDLQENEPMNAHVGDRDILLVRQGSSVYATGASCPHKGAALADGLVVGNEVRCPFHHACFDLKTGAASAPSLDPDTVLACGYRCRACLRPRFLADRKIRQASRPYGGTSG